ncbi:hypothetical protein SERLA73DRAFT_152098 [Serpula lacrymans var. lacrymans S7.3]|uniref:Uncharacterized protein n=2 Tax=Serpula lacrymans var. lacrymans TaxID=341189 RepID=F8PWB6_SERL3|nr:uncharacterized protein SERLADRAFT_368890 [Serpula lacrymans var. lacrymans S7.9]EGN99921.1 hypothetical protein SERLA73DRAFT_152098 [Serpula lacrymans var. lacrymans S7.3]EGO25490.1 hypothetical protein SERLADRAFT_368890 [Serpula lacrymans var. lacrymans S7.9]
MSSPPLSVSSLLHSLHPIRKPKLRYRTTFLALFGLIVLSTYILFVAKPSLDLAPITLRNDPTHHEPPHAVLPHDPVSRTPSSRVFRFPPSQNHKSNTRPQVELSPAQELAAVSSFLASLPQNMIPRSVDPTKPIDPQVVLDFDTRSTRAAEEVHQIEEEVWARHPVVLFTKLHSAASREVRFILANMMLRPMPTVFDVDQREDAEVLTPLLHRLTSSTELPILLVGGKPVGSMSEIRSLHESGELKKMISDAGAVIDGAKKKKGRK